MLNRVRTSKLLGLRGSDLKPALAETTIAAPASTGRAKLLEEARHSAGEAP